MKDLYEFECWNCQEEFETKIRRPKSCPVCRSEKIARQYTMASSSRYRTRTALQREKYAKELQQPYVDGKRNEQFDKLYPNSEVSE